MHPCTSSPSQEDEGLRVGGFLPTAAASLPCTHASLHPMQPAPLRISRLQLLQPQWSLFFHLCCSQLRSVLCQVLNLEGHAAGCCAVLRWAPICSLFYCTFGLLHSCHVCCQVLLLRALHLQQLQLKPPPLLYSCQLRCTLLKLAGWIVVCRSCTQFGFRL